MYGGRGCDGQLLLQLIDTHCEDVLHGHGEEAEQADVRVHLLVELQHVQLCKQHIQQLQASWTTYGLHHRIKIFLNLSLRSHTIKTVQISSASNNTVEVYRKGTSSSMFTSEHTQPECMQQTSPLHQAQQLSSPQHQSQQQESDQHLCQQEERVTHASHENGYAVNQLLPQQEHVDLKAGSFIHSDTAVIGQEGGEEKVNHQPKHTGETCNQNGAFLVEAEPGNFMLLHSFTGTDDEATPEDGLETSLPDSSPNSASGLETSEELYASVSTPVEEEYDLGSIETDGPDRSSGSGTAKSPQLLSVLVSGEDNLHHCTMDRMSRGAHYWSPLLSTTRTST